MKKTKLDEAIAATYYIHDCLIAYRDLVNTGSSKAMLFVETGVIDGHVTYCVESKEYDDPFKYSYLSMAIKMYNKLCM